MKQGYLGGKDSRVRVTVGVILQASDLIVSCPDAKPEAEFPLPNANIMSGRKMSWTSQQKGVFPFFPGHQWPSPTQRCIPALCPLSSAEILVVTMYESSFCVPTFPPSSQCWPDGPILVF
ncbi:uncharacterized protein BO96DRAFT_80443 [Aspergillus niger CBS 101883]|uniref:uncharacterized protein n=1 Tax=Aspergillus lacticoffeatus (strain CBS 101883) TaxID=1450533 RepID=UPI000D7EC547|nr:uncharacterized protein BO96DRAFT_80443 [Aspergillus niger CBS 101883]PYH54809.1 hypothetical protein BO96DRAFT_80443 [Aspergillus niger CBS 101883]